MFVSIQIFMARGILFCLGLCVGFLFFFWVLGFVFLFFLGLISFCFAFFFWGLICGWVFFLGFFLFFVLFGFCLVSFFCVFKGEGRNPGSRQL